MRLKTVLGKAWMVRLISFWGGVDYFFVTVGPQPLGFLVMGWIRCRYAGKTRSWSRASSTIRALLALLRSQFLFSSSSDSSFICPLAGHAVSEKRETDRREEVPIAGAACSAGALVTSPTTALID